VIVGAEMTVGLVGQARGLEACSPGSNPRKRVNTRGIPFQNEIHPGWQRFCHPLRGEFDFASEPRVFTRFAGSTRGYILSAFQAEIRPSVD
jgi:hypothetical protein